MATNARQRDRVSPLCHKTRRFHGDTKKNIGPKELVAECEAWRNRAESEKSSKALNLDLGL